ncbi:hypothetical protein [Sphingomonas azotifigens]|uniref:hypothetical protein n=1 Tax=Sphingomonas azotifigens TaxID=330920 RepID=UPI00111C3A33|nr:hypothetical protein [Sphingomonas azotifigens]
MADHRPALCRIVFPNVIELERTKFLTLPPWARGSSLERFHLGRRRSKFLIAAFSESMTVNGQLENALIVAAFNPAAALR